MVRIKTCSAVDKMDINHLLLLFASDQNKITCKIYLLLILLIPTASATSDLTFCLIWLFL